mmetsp:Transcript_48389/g.155751  ORF Transcript_48389/g.155751 Transcript_48389/m.155751 type:complete len:207 (+) Transcript_48389:187-807(+)
MPFAAAAAADAPRLARLPRLAATRLVEEHVALAEVEQHDAISPILVDVAVHPPTLLSVEHPAPVELVAAEAVEHAGEFRRRGALLLEREVVHAQRAVQPLLRRRKDARLLLPLGLLHRPHRRPDGAKGVEAARLGGVEEHLEVVVRDGVALCQRRGAARLGHRLGRPWADVGLARSNVGALDDVPAMRAVKVAKNDGEDLAAFSAE